MNTKATILTTEKVPAYIREIAKRLAPCLMDFHDDDGDWWGYTFRLNAKWKCGYENQLKTDCEKLVAWCNAHNAHSTLIRYSWWYNDAPLPNSNAIRGSKEHRQRAWKSGFRNHAYLVISDPVAYRFEKDGFYKD